VAAARTNWAKAPSSPLVNSQEHQEFSLPFDSEAKVVKLSDRPLCRPRGRA